MLARTRHRLYGVMVCLALAAQLSTILSVGKIWSDNDISRWLTIQALVEDHTYVIGSLEDGVRTYEGRETVDRVFHRDEHVFVSDKIPLLATVVAGEIAVLHFLGVGLPATSLAMVRMVLVTMNWLPLIPYLLCVVLLVERFGKTDFGRILAVALACFGTFVSSFSVTLTNHTVAAHAVAVALYGFVRAYVDGDDRPRFFLLTGFSAAWCVVNDLPMAPFAGALFGFLLVRNPRRTLQAALPAASIPLAAFIVTNELAFGQPLPWYGVLDFSRTSPWTLHYPGSAWDIPGLVGPSEPNVLRYVMHYMVGHHGLLSLTPCLVGSLALMLALPNLRVMLFALAVGIGAVALGAPRGACAIGVVVAATVALVWRFRSRDAPTGEDAVGRLIAYAFTTVAAVVFLKSTNYGGMTCGPRHLLALTPLLVLGVAIDMSEQPTRATKALSLFALFVSMSFALGPWRYGGSPWTPPWIIEWFY
jgi:hypothetical protein